MSPRRAAACFLSLLLLPATLLAQKKDAPSTFVVALKIPGVGNSTGGAFFKSVSGLSSETEVVEFREGGQNDSIRKIAGRTKYPNIILKRGLTIDTSVAVWRRLVEDGQFQQARKDGMIVIYDKTNKELARWSIINAWPSAISIETDADTGDPLEVITLAVDASRRQ